MLVKTDDSLLQKLQAYLSTCEDACKLNDNNYALDFYDCTTPVTLELEFAKQGIEVLAIAELKYDDGMDGYYMAERIEDEVEIVRIIGELLTLI